MRIHVVLVEPEIPQNTGNIARTCAATGAVLHLVEPLGFSIDSREVKRAGLDYWEDLTIKVHSSLDTFLTAYGNESLWFFSTKAPRNYCELPVDAEEDIFLVFGKETQGLPEDLLRSRIDFCARIPMLEGARSLNLSNSVAVAVYDLLRRCNFPGLRQTGSMGQEKYTI